MSYALIKLTKTGVMYEKGIKKWHKCLAQEKEWKVKKDKRDTFYNLNMVLT